MDRASEQASIQVTEKPSRISVFSKLLEDWQPDMSNVPEPKSPSDIFAVLHQNVVDKTPEDTSTDFQRTSTQHGTLILQKKFIELVRSIPGGPIPTDVQSDLRPPDPEIWKALGRELSEIGVEELLSEYLDSLAEHRDYHNHLLVRAYATLDEEVQNDISAIIPTLRYGGKVSHLVGIVSPFDPKSDTIWEQFGISLDEIERINDWSKIDESGVVLASKDHQSGEKAHDYFTFALNEAENKGISVREQLIENTCLHEGRGHGFVVSLLDHYLGYSKIYSTEGFAGGLGQDHRVNQSVTQQELQDFLSDKLPRDEDRMYDIGYRIMPVFLTKLHSAVMKARGVNDEKAWEEIIAASLNGARTISQIQGLTPDAKHAKFMPEMLKLLKYKDDLEAVLFQPTEVTHTPLKTTHQFAPSLVSIDTA